MNEIRTGVLVIGGGAAGIYAALEAHRRGTDVCLADKSMVGVGGATVMAQMTVAAALGHAEPDSPDVHLADTLAGGKGLVNRALAELLCEDAPKRIVETYRMRVNWAHDGDTFRQVTAPGHSRRRCCYVDVLATGTGLVKGLKAELRRRGVVKHQNLFVTELIADGEGRVVGAAALDVLGGEPLRIWADAVVLACGGLTEMYLRNSASVNLTGDAYAIGLAAGAELVDFEMVQFFPIANLAPRTIGLDPIMWDPFRYKLGGRLLNGNQDEFIGRYAGVADNGAYTATRDVVSYAILKEVEAGRGSPAGGAWLDFRDLDAERIRAAFPPVVDKLLAQGIDLTQQAVEVAPIAHYTIGGLRVDRTMATSVAGLYAAGEAVGGAHGANRLSGNAVSEALVFGARAGESAAGRAAAGPATIDGAARDHMVAATAAIMQVPGRDPDSRVFLPALRRRLQTIMWNLVGPFRDESRLTAAGQKLRELEGDLEGARVAKAPGFNTEWVEWFEMKNMLTNAEAIRVAALSRRDSIGAHQREDYPALPEGTPRNSVLSRRDGGLAHRWVEVTDQASAGVAS